MNLTIQQLITMLETYKKLLGDVEVSIQEVNYGPNVSDRYGVGMGLKVGNIEIDELQNYVETGCRW